MRTTLKIVLPLIVSVAVLSVFAKISVRTENVSFGTTFLTARRSLANLQKASNAA